GDGPCFGGDDRRAGEPVGRRLGRLRRGGERGESDDESDDHGTGEEHGWPRGGGAAGSSGRPCRLLCKFIVESSRQIAYDVSHDWIQPLRGGTPVARVVRFVSPVLVLLAA